MRRKGRHQQSRHEPLVVEPELRGLVATIDALKAANATERPRETPETSHQYPQNAPWLSESERQHYLAAREELVRHPGPNTLLRQIEIRRAAQRQRECEAEAGRVEGRDRWQGTQMAPREGGRSGVAREPEMEDRRTGDSPLGSWSQRNGWQTQDQQGEDEDSFSDDDTMVEERNLWVQRV